MRGEPRIGINVAVLDGGRVLLTRREDFAVWCLPGGAVSGSETVVEAAIRETREETGLDVRLDRLVGLYFQTNGFHTCVFSATQIGGELAICPEEVTEIGWFPRVALPDDMMWWYRLRAIKALDGATGEVWLQDMPPALYQDRAALYVARDEAGGSRADFYQRYLAIRGPRGEERQL